MEIYKNLSLEDLPNEEWRDVVGYEGFYQVSNLGRVKSLSRLIKRGRGWYRKPTIVLKPQLNGRGYFQVSLFNEFDKQIKTIHQIVAQAFIPNPNNYTCIDHINTIKTDNFVRNLRWCNHQMNMLNPITKNKVDEIRKSICKEDWYIDKQRKNQPFSKKVLQFNKNGTFVREWNTISEASRAMNTSVQAISHCCNGKTATSKSFIWKFKQI